MEYEKLINIAKGGLNKLIEYIDTNADLLYEQYNNTDFSYSIDIYTFDDCMGSEFLCGFDFTSDGKYIGEY